MIYCGVKSLQGRKANFLKKVERKANFLKKVERKANFLKKVERKANFLKKVEIIVFLNSPFNH